MGTQCMKQPVYHGGVTAVACALALGDQCPSLMYLLYDEIIMEGGGRMMDLLDRSDGFKLVYNSIHYQYYFYQ